jgi:REP element-mobilizing transposase RayT
MQDNKAPNRKSPRLKVWDYSNPYWYFVTICTDNHVECFGEIVCEKVRLNEFGTTAYKCWKEIPAHYKNVELDDFVIMTNHLHGIVILNDVGSRHASTKGENELIKGGTCPAPTLGNVIGSFKSAVTKWANENGYNKFKWQRSYYDRIIRNEKELYLMRNYIKLNPFKWDLEKSILKTLKYNYEVGSRHDLTGDYLRIAL